MRRILLACAVLVAIPWAVPARVPVLPAATAGEPTAPLLDYIARPDAGFRWERRSETRVNGATVVELRLVSQVWRGIPWKHRLWVARPPEVRAPGQGMLFVTGGAWREAYDGAGDGDGRVPREVQYAALGAQQTGTVVAVLAQVPFQPMFDGMTEDALISYTFAQWLATREDDWPLLLPMTKSAVRAMDAVQAFAREAWQLPVQKFVVTGASKRGWTTWLTGAVDPRVNGIAPMVIDVLNMAPQMRHQQASFGGFSEEIADYSSRGLTGLAETVEGRELLAIVDPYSYRARLTMPKVILLGTNDRYWPLDALSLYWDGLVGEKRVCYVPNNGHGLSDLARILGALGTLTRHVSGSGPLPAPAWEFAAKPDGCTCTLRPGAGAAPARVVVWRATAPTRDFRGATWAEQPLDGRDGVFTWSESRPATGYAAFFLETVYDTAPGTPPFHASTNVRILRSREPEDF